MFELRPFTRCAWVLSFAAIAACSDSNEPIATRNAIYVSLSPQATTVQQGDSSTVVVSLSSSGRFAGVPQLTITGAPTGVAVRIVVSQSSPIFANALVVLKVDAEVAPGTYLLSMVASDGGVYPVTLPLSLRVVFRASPCTLTDLCAQWARSATASSQYTSDEWSAKQATGAPNVNGCNDDPLAWASAEANDGEWLQLEFEHSVFPTRVEVFETLTTSGIVKVELRDEASTWHTVYTATPKELDCPRVLAIPVTNVTVKVKAVRIYIDQSVLGYWNEIDAVMLIGYRQK